VAGIFHRDKRQLDFRIRQIVLAERAFADACQAGHLVVVGTKTPVAGLADLVDQRLACRVKA